MNSASLGPSVINHWKERHSFHESQMSKDFEDLLKARQPQMEECAPASCLLNEASQNVWDTPGEVTSLCIVPRFRLRSSWFFIVSLTNKSFNHSPRH